MVEHVTDGCTCEGKKCTKCQHVWCIGKYYNHKHAPDGLQWWCKDCSHESVISWREHNPDKANAPKPWPRPPKPTELQICETCGNKKNCFYDASKGKWRYTCNSCKNRRTRERNPNYFKERNARRDPEGRKREYAQRLARNPNHFKELTARCPGKRKPPKKRLPPEQYALKLEQQGGVCAICKNPEIERHVLSGKIKSLAIDHNHATGQNRGLLCCRCNIGIGYLNDDPDRLRAAIAYLEYFSEGGAERNITA